MVAIEVYGWYNVSMLRGGKEQKMNLKKGNIKYIAKFNKLCVIDREENKVYYTQAIGIDEEVKGKNVSHIYDVLYGRDISDTKRYDIHLIQPNFLGFGGTKVKPIYLEEGWNRNNEED